MWDGAAKDQSSHMAPLETIQDGQLCSLHCPQALTPPHATHIAEHCLHSGHQWLILWMWQGAEKYTVQPTSFFSLWEVSELNFQMYHSVVNLTERFKASRTYFFLVLMQMKTHKNNNSPGIFAQE